MIYCLHVRSLQDLASISSRCFRGFSLSFDKKTISSLFSTCVIMDFPNSFMFGCAVCVFVFLSVSLLLCLSSVSLFFSFSLLLSLSLSQLLRMFFQRRLEVFSNARILIAYIIKRKLDRGPT